MVRCDYGMAMGDDPYSGLTDDQVLARAVTALRIVKSSPITSIQHGIQWAVYDACTAELNRRLIAHITEKLRDR